MMKSISLAALLLAACGGHAVRPYPEPTASDVMMTLTNARNKLTSFSSESVMDYWFGNDRVKGTVRVMGTPGAHVRFNAIDPADNVMADLACDGRDFVLVDHQHNCVLTGPCNGDSIGQLLHVTLAPDDFFYLAVGATPILPSDHMALTWDASRGLEHLELTGATGAQTILVDGSNGRWDVRKSELRGVDGKVIWSVDNTDFTVQQLTGGDSIRVPQKTRFRSPGEKSDLLVEWKERTINTQLPPAGFTLVPPDGLPICGSKSN